MANLTKGKVETDEHLAAHAELDRHKPQPLSAAPASPIPPSRTFVNTGMMAPPNNRPNTQNFGTMQGMPMAGPMNGPARFTSALALYYQVYFWEPKKNDKSRLSLNQRLALKDRLGNELNVLNRVQFQEGIEKEVEDAEASTAKFSFDPTSSSAPSLEALQRDLELLADEPVLPPSLAAAVEKFHEEFGRCLSPEPQLRPQEPAAAKLHRPEPHAQKHPGFEAAPDE